MSRFEIKKLGSGERFKLDKNLGLDNIRVELTWQNADLDAHAWLLDADGIIVNDEGFVYYNSKNRTEPWNKAKFGNRMKWLHETRPLSADSAVIGPEDELEGGIETINICLSKIAPEVQEVVVSATVYEGVQTFGEVENARITVIDEESGDQLCYYELTKRFQTEDALVAGRFIINDDGYWEFEAVERGYNGGLQTLVDIYTDE